MIFGRVHSREGSIALRKKLEAGELQKKKKIIPHKKKALAPKEDHKKKEKVEKR